MAVSERTRARMPPDGADQRPARIVVADDDRSSREAIVTCLRGGGYAVDAVDNAQDAIERVSQGGVDLVVLDVVMPRLNGLEACRLIKGMVQENFVPVILVTGKADTSSRVEGFRVGADDYICKPIEDLELLARVSAMLRIKRMYDDVALQRAKLRKLSVYDELTGVYNQRFATARLSEEFKRSERYHEPLACMICDIDSVRIIGGSGVSQVDDASVKAVSEKIRKNVREVDILARYTGDSFLVVCPSTNFVGALTVADRIWRDVCDFPFEFDGTAKRISLSVGIALYPSLDIRSKESLLKSAEDAAAQAKRSGGGRICAYQQQGYIYTPPAFGGGPGGSGGPPSSRRSAELAAAGVGAQPRTGSQNAIPKQNPDAPVDSQRRYKPPT